MASGDSPQDGEFGGNKRFLLPGDCSDYAGDEAGRDKRCRLAPVSAREDGESGSSSGGGGGDDVYGDLFQESAGDGDGAGEDYMYDYDCGVDEAEKTKAEASACGKGQSYIVLTEDDLRARQAAETAKVAEVLSIPTGVAAVLLRHFKWGAGRVQEEWFSDDRRVRDAVGLPPDGVPVPAPLSTRELPCGVCFDSYPAGGMKSAGCAHFYCDDCWRGYVNAAVGDGSPCLALRCPDPSCSAAVVPDLVHEVADGAARARYAQFALRSYVEESGGRVKWCPAPGCTCAVEFLGFADEGAATDVFCACRHGFCWSCGEEAHRPVSCGTVRAWLEKNRSDSETANWVMANTKHCPKCRRPIEKNQGCNHMTCRCGHHFCWLCLQPAGGTNHYSCESHRQGRGPPAAAAAGGGSHAGTQEEEAKRQARASLDRYLYHYERWAANQASLRRAFDDMAVLERSGLEAMAAALDVPVTQLAFLTEAYAQIADGRRVLRWAHAYGYYLDPERDAAKRELFDYLQGHANLWLERLHGCAEVERMQLFRDDGDGAAITRETFKAYKEKLANLTGVTRRFLGNLVKAFENDLPEVVKIEN